MWKILVATWLLVAAAVAPAASLVPSRFSSGEEVDAAALGTRLPVVLVHGLGGSGEGWDTLLHAYTRTAAWRAVFKPYTYRYASSASDVLADPKAPRSIQGLGGQFRDELQAVFDKPVADGGFGRRSIVVLAHSMGGLVARSMMQEHAFRDGRRGGERVLHLITLGTPHHGTPLADAGFAVGLAALPEFQLAYAGFVAGLAWDNHDALDMGSGVCNPWLARLNSFQPVAAGSFGRCGTVPGVALPGFYEKIVAYGARTLQQPDLNRGLPGIYKEGSATALLVPYAWLHDGLARSYANDGIVPMASAQFDLSPVEARKEAYACDHRYLERGYRQQVRTWTGAFEEWALCGGTPEGTTTSGQPEGWAVAGSLYAVAGGVFDTLRADNQAERVLDWAEQAYSAELAPAGASTGRFEAYAYRCYAASASCVGIKDGAAWYMGPASGQQIVRVDTLANLLARAQAAGF